MRGLTLLTGAVTSESAKFFVATKETNESPRCFVRKLPDGIRHEVALVPSAVSPKLRSALGRYSIAPFTGEVTALDPHSRYAATAEVGTPPFRSRWSPFQTLPRALGVDEDITIAVASCYYGFQRNGKHYRNALDQKWNGRRPSWLLLTGDNLYLDIAPGQFWEDEGGYPETVHRYEQYYFETTYRQALSKVPLLTTWDDHEFWNNYPEEQVHLSRSKSANYSQFRNAGRECIDLFQASLNPPTVVPPSEASGRSYVTDLAGIPVFVADIRTARERHTGRDSKMFSEGELAALESWAAALESPGLLVLGQPLWMTKGDWRDYNPINFKLQFTRIVQALLDAPFDILVISGDVHFSRLISYRGQNTKKTPGGVRIHEFVSSPATHIPTGFSTVGSSVFGVPPSQDSGSVEAPLRLKVNSPVSPLVKLDLERYYFGTNSPNSIGYLTFRRKAHKTLEVDAGFVDLPSGGPAPVAEMKIHETTGSGSWRPHENPWMKDCFYPRAFSLKERP